LQYHDYHLHGYQVDSRAGTITLHLVYDYPNIPKRESVIRFADVTLYHFTHTGGSIITHIEEMSVAALLDDIGDSVLEWARMQDVNGFNKSLAEYQAHLEAGGFKAWSIDSAIGFSGFVVAKSAGQVEQV
jgi:hypothetical protein